MKHLLSAPPDALGALYFLPGQYLFKRIEGESETVKALSSAAIARAFREYEMDTGWVSRRIIRYHETAERNYLLSYEPGGIKTIFVENELKEVAEIKVPLPTLILFGRGNDFHLWAVKERDPGKETRLCIAPLPNIGGNSSGKICFGGNSVPEARIETLDKIWDLIFQTPFNGDHAGNKCRSETNDVRRFLFDLAAKNSRRFPNSELFSLDATIKDLWARAMANR